MGSVVNVYYGPPSHRRLEGQAELRESKHLGGTRYRVKLVFLGDPPDCVQEREIDIHESSATQPEGGVRKR